MMTLVLKDQDEFNGYQTKMQLRIPKIISRFGFYSLLCLLINLRVSQMVPWELFEDFPPGRPMFIRKLRGMLSQMADNQHLVCPVRTQWFVLQVVGQGYPSFVQIRESNQDLDKLGLLRRLVFREGTSEAPAGWKRLATTPLEKQSTERDKDYSTTRTGSNKLHVQVKKQF